VKPLILRLVPARKPVRLLVILRGIAVMPGKLLLRFLPIIFVFRVVRGQPVVLSLRFAQMANVITLVHLPLMVLLAQVKMVALGRLMLTHPIRPHLTMLSV